MASPDLAELKRALQKYPKAIRDQAILRQIREIYKKDLFLTCKDLLEYSDITRFTHGPMVKALESPKKRKLLCLPRGTFKSSVGVVGFSIWSLMNNPNERILIDSEIFQNSKNFIREIRGKLELPRMVLLFGPWRSSQWDSGSITVAQRTQILKESSVTASGVGAGKTGQHYSKIIMDDLNSDNNSQTPEGRQKVIDHYRMNTSILEPDGTMVVIGTRFATNDVIGTILDTEIKGLISPI